LRRCVPPRLKALAHRLRHVLLLVAGAAAVTTVGVRPTQDVVAQGGTRTLTIYHAHTKEQETVTYKRSGSFDSAGLQKLNWLLRDWRVDEPTRMDPVLFDILWEAHRAAGSSAPIHVVSAYRSPGTNAMLRRSAISACACRTVVSAIIRAPTIRGCISTPAASAIGQR
jgi:uncharacterized protein YcbK (DUF882 family)